MMSKSIIRLLWLKLNLFSSIIKSYPSLTLLGVESHVSFPFRAMQTVSIDHTCQGLTAVTIESRVWVGRWAGGRFSGKCTKRGAREVRFGSHASRPRSSRYNRRLSMQLPPSDFHDVFKSPREPTGMGGLPLPFFAHSEVCIELSKSPLRTIAVLHSCTFRIHLVYSIFKTWAISKLSK